MKSLVSATAALAVTALPSLTLAASIITPRNSCAGSNQLCPTCDGTNLTDSRGDKWSITCDWVIDSDEEEEEVKGWSSPSICMDACDDNDGCFGINFVPNGTCVIVEGEQTGLRSSAGYTNLVRLAAGGATGAPKPASTSHVRITTTLTEPNLTSTSHVPISSTVVTASPKPTGLVGECDLADAELCPKCHGKTAGDGDGRLYTVFCDTTIESDGSYSPQEALSPAECLNMCDELDFCTGATYYDDRSCELAKAHPSAKVDTGKVAMTGFLPVVSRTPSPTAAVTAAATARINSTKSLALDISSTSTQEPEQTFSILPIDPHCNEANMTCPQCAGIAVSDGLQAEYTAFCGREPECRETSIHRDPGTQDLCLQSCDQDALCIAAMWYPRSGACHLCRQGMKTSSKSDLPYVLLAADMEGDDDSGETTPIPINSSIAATTTSSRVASLTLTPSTIASSITEFPAPFSSSANVTSAVNVSPADLSATPTALTISINTGRPLINITSTSSTTPSSSSVPEIANVSCPAYNDHVYVAENGNSFAVGCDSRFDAAHSRYISASDFKACVASCTGSCDGIQFGATTRCGLYTHISVVGPAAGWTVAASVTFPATTAASVPPASLTSAMSVADVISSSTASITDAPVTSAAGNATVPRASPRVTPVEPQAYGYASYK